MNDYLTLDDVIQATGGLLLSNHAVRFDSVGTDTRLNLLNQFFIALKGDAYDAHDYLDQAVKAGATGLLVHNFDSKYDSLKSKATIVKVPDTLIALQKLGAFRRHQWNKTVIAITGSNGKTTTKEFVAQLVSTEKTIHFNHGSFNNHWGVPLTLLGLKSKHELAICEMGMNHLGELQSLVEIAEPDIVGVTVVGRAHLEGLGTIAAIAKAKEEIYLTSNPRARVAIFNLDCPQTKTMYEHYLNSTLRTITFSTTDNHADVFLKLEKMDLDHLEVSGLIGGINGRASVPVFGKQNITNLMFASCAALATGLNPETIWINLSRCKTTWGRNQRIFHPAGAEIIFDGYNANPDSQRALIENLQHLHLNRPMIGIFGEMKEQGANSMLLHEELGGLVSTIPFQKVIYIGNFGDSFVRGFSKKSPNDLLSDSISLFNEVNDSVVNEVKGLLTGKPLITIKGSRGVHLEKILKGLALID
jgi:UDP-N-acetylmuramoyl-tripeptide--D-alanyl-D-alanine ligase